MDIAKDFFNRKRVILSRLAGAGFVLHSPCADTSGSAVKSGADTLAGAVKPGASQSGGDADPGGTSQSGSFYVYSEMLMDGDLTAVIKIFKDGRIVTSVTDTYSGDVYLPINNEAFTGSYAGRAREEYRALLSRIAEKCFIEVLSKRRAGIRYWLIPSRPSQYDVDKGFRDSGNDTLAWHHRIDVMPGDIVYIYQTEPVASIMWECEVLDSYLPMSGDLREFSPRSRYRMILKRLRSFEKGEYPRSWLNEHGVKKTVRGQRSAPAELVSALNDAR